MSSKLRAKVKAANRANEYAHKFYRDLVTVFTPLVGQKLFKNDGEFFKNVKLILPNFQDTPGISVYRERSAYSLAWTVKTNEYEAERGHTIYHSVNVYIGWLENGVLKEIAPPFSGRFDYTTEEIEENREKYRSAKKLADEAKNALREFGEHDNTF